MDEDCVILDLPEGLRLNLLGLIVEIERILVTADRAGLLGGLLASLTCGGVESADRLEALAQVIRSQHQGGEQQPAPEEEEPEPEEEEPETEDDGEPFEEEEPELEEEPQPKPRRRRSR